MCQFLRNRFSQLSVIDTNEITRRGAWNWLWSRQAVRTAAAIFVADLILLAVSRPKIYLLGSWLVIFGALFGKRVVLRSFGGDLDEYYRLGGFLHRTAIRIMLHADVVFLETHHQITFAKRLRPKANIVWLANFRILKQVRMAGSDDPQLADVWPAPPRLRLIFIGHVSREKGVDVLCDAMELCSDLASLVLCGDLIDADLAHCIERIGAMHVGRVDNEYAMRLLDAAEVLVCPSNCPTEGHPGVVIEAFMHGTPVIASDWRSIPEVVTDGSTGLLFESRNARSLAAKIRQMADLATRDRLAKAASSSMIFWDAEHWNDVLIQAVEEALRS